MPRLLLDTRTTRVLLEAADAAGLSRADILGPLGIDEASVVDPSRRVEWNTVVALCGQVSRLVDGDVERLRDIGSLMMKTPSYAPMRRLATALVSPRRLYLIANRFVAPANFPHLTLTTEVLGRRRLRMRGTIPESYVGSRDFLHIFEGSARALVTLLELPRSEIVESTTTTRLLSMTLELPPSRTLLQRARAGLRALAGAPSALRVLGEQQRELTRNVTALQQARDELSVLLDRLPDLVVIHVDGKIVWSNRLFSAALGYEAHELVGTALIDHVAPRSRALVKERMRQPTDARATLELQEATLQTKAGAELVVEAAPTQTVVFDGVPARLIVARDVSERLHMQQKLIVADRLASVGLLAAGVAHEVNNPLAYVLNNIEIAQKELAGLGHEVETSRGALRVALEGVDRIRAIVRELLLLSRGDAGRLGYADLGVVAQSTLDLAAREIESTAKLVRDIAPTPSVRGSDSRIVQVLLNLVGNALEAMRGRPRADNVLTVRVANADDGRVLLQVSDTGCGISPSDLARIFEPFFTTKPAGQGTGLGLAIAQRLVVEMGGEIEVSSEVGRGTTFRVLFPPGRERRASETRELAQPVGR